MMYMIGDQTETQITWTREKLDAFKVAYAAASKTNLGQFKFEGHAFVTEYAFYLIEFLENQGLS